MTPSQSRYTAPDVVSTVSTSGERAITAATPAATTAVSPALPGVLRLSFTLVMKSVVDTRPCPSDDAERVKASA